MNAEKHLRSILDRLAADKRTGVHHLALFGTLGRMWKDSRYASPFTINRQQVQKASKLRSVLACDQALQELDEWEYLQYFPSQTVAHRREEGTAARLSPEADALVSLNLPSILPAVPKRRRPASRVVMPRVISAQTTLFSGGENEINKSAVGVKLVQLAIQAVIQLVIALLNKHLDLF